MSNRLNLMRFHFRMLGIISNRESTLRAGRRTLSTRFTRRTVWLYFVVTWLTKSEQLFLCIVVGLFLTGLAVKAYRTSHPPAQTSQQTTR
jgi:hypothetical protein